MSVREGAGTPVADGAQAAAEVPEAPVFGFVVLHYKTLDETLACVESIKQVVGYPERRVVVVDNGSGDGTGEELERRFTGDPLVTVLRNLENLGFARGNNVGFRYATRELGCTYLCLLNSDVVITQPDICERVIDVMERTGAALVGPKIVNPDGTTLGPHTFPGLAFLEPDTRDMEVSLKAAERGVDASRRILCRRLLHTLLVRGYRAQRPRLLDADAPHDDAVVEGCCLFFSPEYLLRFDGLDERTFLYHEEDLLYLHLQDAGMHARYDPSISILHNHHATTRALAGSELEYKAFRLRHQLESRAILLQELRGRAA